MRGENVDALFFSNYKGSKKRESEGDLHAMGDSLANRRDSVSLTGKYDLTQKEENGIKQVRMKGGPRQTTPCASAC